VLLRSTGVEITLRGETPARYRQLFRQIKFHRLICDVTLVKENTYHLQLDGPLSLFSATQKYGLQLALFLPALLLCKHFELKAKLRWGAERKDKVFHLSAKDGLVSHLAETGAYVPPEVPMFVELFKKKIADWDISDETEIISLGKNVWVPDYRLIHRATGNVVLLDILGFWRRSSVERHLEMLKAHAGGPFIVALSDQLNVEESELAALPENVVRFRNMPLPEEVVKLACNLLRN
jgi:predicted nuclease of restriction endonuclease-like RecB superfamily